MATQGLRGGEDLAKREAKKKDEWPDTIPSTRDAMMGKKES